MNLTVLQQDVVNAVVSPRTRRTAKDEINHDELQAHIYSAYNSQRWGMAFISFVFPLLLIYIGWFWYKMPIQNSLSAYYYAKAPGQGPLRSLLANIDIFPIKYLLSFLTQLDGEAPMRSWFVGTLFVIGILLILYKGFSPQENIGLNVAGLSALMVAIFPMEWNCGDNCHWITIHGIFAIVTFLCITIVALTSSKQTLRFLPDERQKKYDKWYTRTSIAMVTFPVVAYVITQLINDNTVFILIAECLGIWSFAAYWLIKSKELKESQAEMLALEKKLNVSPN